MKHSDENIIRKERDDKNREEGNIKAARNTVQKHKFRLKNAIKPGP